MSMKTIAIMTMIFLPGTFFSSLFAIPTLKWEGEEVVSERFWVYWVFTIPSTLVTVSVWLIFTEWKFFAETWNGIVYGLRRRAPKCSR